MRIYFNESELTKTFDLDIVKLDSYYWQVVQECTGSEEPEKSLNFWKKYLELTDDDQLKTRLNWIINNWTPDLIKTVC